METALVIWMIGTLPSMANGLVFIGSLFTLLSLFGFVFAYIEEHSFRWLALFGVIFFGIIWIIGAIIPDKETAYTMAAGYGVQKVAESPKVQEVASDAGDILSMYLRKVKKELEEESK